MQLALIIVPIFALILLGALLKRYARVAGEGWRGIERLIYFVFFPALLFHSLSHAQITKVLHRSGIIRFVSVRRFEMIVRFIVSSQKHEQMAQAVMCLGKCRSDPKGFAVMVHRALRISAF